MLRRTLLLGVPSLLVLLALWAGWQAWQLNKDLRAAVDDAAVLEEALRSGDQPAAVTALGSLRGHAGAAADRPRASRGPGSRGSRRSATTHAGCGWSPRCCPTSPPTG